MYLFIYFCNKILKLYTDFVDTIYNYAVYKIEQRSSSLSLSNIETVFMLHFLCHPQSDYIVNFSLWSSFWSTSCFIQYWTISVNFFVPVSLILWLVYEVQYGDLLNIG